MIGVVTDAEPPIAQPWLRLDCDGLPHAFLMPDEGATLRDYLRSKDEPAAQRLAGLIDSAVTTLLAAPLHAGTRTVRVTGEERDLVLEAARVLEQNPLDRFARLRHEWAQEPF